MHLRRICLHLICTAKLRITHLPATHSPRSQHKSLLTSQFQISSTNKQAQTQNIKIKFKRASVLYVLLSQVRVLSKRLSHHNQCISVFALDFSTVRWGDLNARSGHNTLFYCCAVVILAGQLAVDTCAMESADHVTLLSRRRPRVHWSAVDILPAYRRDCSSSGRFRDRKCSLGGGWTSLVIPFRFCWSSCCYCGGDGSPAKQQQPPSDQFLVLSVVCWALALRADVLFAGAGGGSRISPLAVIRFWYRNRADSWTVFHRNQAA